MPIFVSLPRFKHTLIEFLSKKQSILENLQGLLAKTFNIFIRFKNIQVSKVFVWRVIFIIG